MDDCKVLKRFVAGDLEFDVEGFDVENTLIFLFINLVEFAGTGWFKQNLQA